MGLPKTLLTCFLVFVTLYNCQAFLTFGEPRAPLLGKSWPPGSPWPLPFSWKSTAKLVTFDASTFKIYKDFSIICEPIDFIIGHYNNRFLFPVYNGSTTSADPKLPVVNEVVIKLTGKDNECSQYPRLSNDEACEPE